MTDDGDIPKLYNLDGDKYDIKDVMGQFNKDEDDNIVLKREKPGMLVDNLGRKVNDKGYLVDDKDNIIDKNGKLLFPKSCLLNNEFPKIFPFTKFRPKCVIGDFDRDLDTNKPILERD